MEKTITVPYNFEPRDYQLSVFNALDGIEGDLKTKKKRVFLMWHRRAGKDTMSAAYMFKEMVMNPGIYYYFFPTYSQGKKAIWEHFDTRTGFRIMDMLYGFRDSRSHGKPGSLIKPVNNQELRVELTNGSIFRVIGTDNYWLPVIKIADKNENIQKNIINWLNLYSFLKNLSMVGFLLCLESGIFITLNNFDYNFNTEPVGESIIFALLYLGSLLLLLRYWVIYRNYYTKYIIRAYTIL